MTGRAASAGVVEHGSCVVEGRRVLWRAAGRGSPTVILEAGLTASASEWLTILPRLARNTRVLAVSRAGYGGSDPVGRRTGHASVADLRAVLDQLDVKGPLVLVGHSWGGVVVRLLAAQVPTSVAGVVLVDATHEGLAQMRGRATWALGQLGMTLAGWQARTGRMRKDLEAGKGPLGPALARAPQAERPALIDELVSASTWRQARRDHPAVAAVLRELHQQPLPPLGCPVVAVVGGRGEGKEAVARELMRSTYERWLTTVPEGRLVIAPQSGHLVPQEDEDLLVQVIEDLVASLRQRQPL